MKAARALAVTLILSLCVSVALADQIVLKNGEKYSGRFVRGDDKTVEFRILGRVESFKVADVSQIIFSEPEIVEPAAAPARAAGVPSTAAASDKTPVLPEATPPSNQPPAITSASSYTFPVGTAVTIRTTAPIDTERSKVGDTFRGVLEESLMAGDQVVVPKGTDVQGAIAYARQSGKIAGQSELILELTEVNVGGKSYILQTSDYRQVSASRGAQTAKTAGGIAALGAVIGAIAGGGTGAAVGAVTGAAVGAGAMVLTKGPTIRVPSETLLEFKLEHELVVDRR